MQPKIGYGIADKSVLIVIQHLGYLKHMEKLLLELSNEKNKITIFYYKKKSNFSPSQITRIQNTPNINLIYLDKIFRKKQFRIAQNLRSTLDSLHYTKDAFKTYSELANRYPLPNNMGESIAERIFAKYSADEHRDLNRLTSKNKTEILGDVFEIAIQPRLQIRKKIKSIAPEIIIISPYLDGDVEPYAFVKIAREEDIPTLLYMASWDNLLNKGVAIPKPNSYVVWTDFHKKQLVDLHEADERCVHVTGSEIMETWPTSSFMRLSHRDPLKILYTCSSNFISQKKEDEFLCALIVELKILKDKKKIDKFTIRTHPQIKLEKIHVFLKKHNSLSEWVSIDLIQQNANDNLENQTNFINNVRNHDLCLGINTSIMLEACALGIPVISINSEFEDFKFPKTLHSEFLNKYASATIKTFDQITDVIENYESIIEIAKSKTDDFKVDFIGHDKSSSARVIQAIQEILHSHQQKEKTTNIDHINLRRNYQFLEFIKILLNLLEPTKWRKLFYLIKKRQFRKLYFEASLYIGNVRANVNSGDSLERQEQLLKTEPLSNKPRSILTKCDVVAMNSYSHKFKNESEFQNFLNDATSQLKKMLLDYDEVIVGPWFSELGFELLYWIPYLNTVLKDHAEAGKKVVSVSRGGMSSLYSSISTEHINLLNNYSQSEWLSLTNNVWAKLGGLKQSSLLVEDLKILEASIPIETWKNDSRKILIHPRILFALFRPYWRNKDFNPLSIVDQITIPLQPNPEPQSGIFTKIYSRPSLELNEANTKSLLNFLNDFPEDKLLITDDSYIDDHPIFNLGSSIKAREHVQRTFENNLEDQINLYKSCEKSITTYGGLSYLALYFQKSSLSLYSDAEKFDIQHLKLAKLLAGKVGINFEVIDVNLLPKHKG